MFPTQNPGSSSPSMRIGRWACVLAVLAAVQGCAVVAVADAAVTVAATAVKVTAKAAGAVVDAVIPDSDDDKKKD